MKNTLYRKLLYVISMVLLSLVAVLLFRPEEGIFRMHVIANSDSAADQATKIAVRDAILDYERGMGNVGSAGEVKARLMDDGRGICAAIDKVLSERGMDYSAELHIGTYDFPDREYGGRLYPAGRYQALRVILGEGKGKQSGDSENDYILVDGKHEAIISEEMWNRAQEKRKKSRKPRGRSEEHRLNSSHIL